MQQERNRSLHHASHVPSNSSPICCRSLHPLTHMAQQAFGSSQATVRPHASQPPSGTASAGVLPLLLALPSAAVIVNRSSNKSTARQRRQGRGCRKSVSRGSGRRHTSRRRLPASDGGGGSDQPSALRPAACAHLTAPRAWEGPGVAGAAPGTGPAPPQPAPAGGTPAGALARRVGPWLRGSTLRKLPGRLQLLWVVS